MAKKTAAEMLQETFKGFMDEEKQRIVAKALIEDNKLYTQINRIINVNAFSELPIRLIMNEVRNYYNEKKVVPTYDILEVALLSSTTDAIERQEYKAIIESLKAEQLLPNLHFYRDKAIRFFKQQETIKLSNKIMKSIENGYEDGILRDILEEAKEILAPIDNELGVSPEDCMMEIFNDEDEEHVTSGYFELDAITGGGLQKGNVGLLAAHTGAGKTTFSTAMAVMAAIKGYNVLQVVFEESEKDIIKKQYACLTRNYVSTMNKKKLSDGVKAEIARWMPVISPRIRVKRMANQKTTWEDVENLINNLTTAQNFRPDIVFIDYFDCLQHSTNTRRSPIEAATRCIKKIDAFAKDFKCAIWVMQQTNRHGASAATKNDVEANIQGTFAVQQTTAVNMFLTKSEEEKTSNKATLHIKKNRQGCLCNFESFYFNNGNLQVDFSVGMMSPEAEQAINEYRAEAKTMEWGGIHTELQRQYSMSQNAQIEKAVEINPIQIPMNNGIEPIESICKMPDYLKQPVSSEFETSSAEWEF